MSALASKWTSQFYATLGDDRLAADEQSDASVRFDLARWTSTLTGVVVRSFEALGWTAAGKGHRCTVLPVLHSPRGAEPLIPCTPRKGARAGFSAALSKAVQSH